MIENTVVFAPGLIVAGTDLYEKIELPNLMNKYCMHHLISKRKPFIVLEHRIKELLHTLRPLGKFHLIGHSSGGIEARAVLSKHPELWQKCLSVTTIGSPHKGSPLADLLVKNGNKPCAYIFDHLFSAAGKNAKEIILEMTTEYMSKMNQDLKPIEGVACFSMPFIMDSEWKLSAFDKFNWNLMKSLGHEYSDGVVTLDSQLFGTPIGDINFGNFHINHGSHKAQTLPFKYGTWPWSSIWTKTFKKAFDVIAKVELEHKLSSK